MSENQWWFLLLIVLLVLAGLKVAVWILTVVFLWWLIKWAVQ